MKSERTNTSRAAIRNILLFDSTRNRCAVLSLTISLTHSIYSKKLRKMAFFCQHQTVVLILYTKIKIIVGVLQSTESGRGGDGVSLAHSFSCLFSLFHIATYSKCRPNNTNKIYLIHRTEKKKPMYSGKSENYKRSQPLTLRSKKKSRNKNAHRMKSF